MISNTFAAHPFTSHSPWECNRAQVLSLAPLSHPSGCPNCGKTGPPLAIFDETFSLHVDAAVLTLALFSGHSAFHCPEAPFNELLLRPGADISRSAASHLFSCSRRAVVVAHKPSTQCRAHRPLEKQQGQEKQKKYSFRLGFRLGG